MAYSIKDNDNKIARQCELSGYLFCNYDAIIFSDSISQIFLQ